MEGYSTKGARAFPVKNFSVVLTYYGRPDMLNRALYCLAQQTYEHFEVVPIFDGHCSAGLQLYAQFCEVMQSSKYRSPIVFGGGCREHHGNACRQYALSSCGGDYVLWYGHDNLIDKDFLQTHAQQVQDGMCISVVGQRHFSNRERTIFGLCPGDRTSYRGQLPLSGVDKDGLKIGALDLLQYAVPLYAAKRWAFPEEHWGTYEADWLTFASIRKNEPDLEVRVNPVPVCGHF